MTDTEQCVDLSAYYYANAAITMITDWAILVLPMHPLWNVQLPLRQRLSLILLFALGSMYVDSSQLISTKF
jgi:hypothetical protein